MKQRKNICIALLHIMISAAICLMVCAAAPTDKSRLVGKSFVYEGTETIEMYAADGRTLVIPASEQKAYENVGWYTQPVRTMFAADGRTFVIPTAETELYENVGWFTEPPVIMYAADGRTLAVKQNEVTLYENVGWFTEPPVIMYAADGRTLAVKQNEITLYENVGWFTKPPVIMYAADGRTLAVKQNEVTLYENVGWFTEPPVIMYAADGRTLAVKQNEVTLYENVGWFTKPPVIMYAADGRTLAVKQNEVTLYENVGWFTEPPIRVYAVDGRILDIKKSELNAYLNVGWYRSPADFPKTGALVALTFDDGPSKYTNRILDCLAKYNAKATFFVVGNSVSSYPDVVKRAYSMGMEIGNHTMTHPNLKTLSADGVSRELNNAANKVSALTGIKPKLLRPPYGNYNSTVSSVAGMPLILWSIDTLDWKTRNADKTVSCVLNEVKDGSIILMHDLYEPTASAAERIIPELVNRGYKLVTVSELAKAKGYTLTNGKAYSSFK